MPVNISTYTDAYKYNDRFDVGRYAGCDSGWVTDDLQSSGVTPRYRLARTFRVDILCTPVKHCSALWTKIVADAPCNILIYKVLVARMITTNQAVGGSNPSGRAIWESRCGCIGFFSKPRRIVGPRQRLGRSTGASRRFWKRGLSAYATLTRPTCWSTTL